jgi:hypothetical protein
MTETITKQRKGYAKPTERLTAAAALIGAGMTPTQAAEQLGYSTKGVGDMVTRIKEKGLGHFLTEKRVKTATHVVDTFMKGKPIGRKIEQDGEGKLIVIEPGIYPKDSTIKDCAMSVLDRQYPKQADAGQINVSFTKIDLTIYQPPQHMVCTQAPGVTDAPSQ